MKNNEDAARWAIPSVHVVDDEQLKGQYQEPVSKGGSLPQLGLAQSPIDVASGQAFQTMPDPPRPEIVWPTLSGSPECGGYDAMNPSAPAPDLACSSNCVDYTPASGPILPSYIEPDWSSLNPSLSGGSDDIYKGSITYSPGGEWGADPDLPDLTDYRHPMGLTFHQSSPADIFKPDPLTGDLTDYEVPNGIHVINDPKMPDPPLPDLQNPDLEPQVRMAPEDRPGDIAPGAMDLLRNSADYGQTKGVAYDLSYMTQPGSSRRSRHMDMLTHGLDGDL